MKRYDAVIFDLDGTLLDTLEDLTDSLNFILKQHGLPEKTLVEVRDLVGNGASRLIKSAIPAQPDSCLFDSCLKGFKAHYEGNAENKTRPYPGITTLVRSLFADGYRLAVVSNKPDAVANKLIRKWFGAYIGITAGEHGGAPRKPDPAMVYSVTQRLGAAPERALYVGDSEIDVLTARNAGVDFIGVTWGFRDRGTLLKAGANILIDAPGDLLKFI